ncbi:hypothetical protein SAMN04487775_10532 [Treponema bryantii]|uniref:DUF1566 domain-containing protein n=1 Tax=Treponema bryantii TaxID=163 RepID=A0A1I3KL74_9SPIR|nr:hypothetical protein [Treponema bryantii]SFI73236.1 hypothetical protein SAMN04487775_10532 [Treponema bryantii]
MKVFSKLNLLFIFILFSFLLISCNANSRYSVGDIVLDDGTVLAPSDFDAYKGNSKPMAVIFSTSGGHEEKSFRVLGVGLNPSEPLKFTPKTSKGYITNILANQTIVVAQEYSIAEGQYNNGGFFGLIDGRKSWKNIGLYDDNAKKSFADYPAYDYAVNYGINNNLKKYKNGWYLPTACEAYELAETLETVQPSVKKCGAAELKSIIWTSSQNYGAQENEFVVDLHDASVDVGFKEMEYPVYSIYCFAD